jgi:hypothetical protein
MHQQATGRGQRWDKDFPGLIPDSPVLAQPIPLGGFELEGNIVQAVGTGHTDTDDTTVLHVASIGLVVAGDVAYNGVHQYLLESGHGGIQAWLKGIDLVAALEPRAVVAGHKNRDRPDDPAILNETRDYLLDAQRLFAAKPGPREFFNQIPPATLGASIRARCGTPHLHCSADHQGIRRCSAPCGSGQRRSSCGMAAPPSFVSWAPTSEAVASM